MRVSATCPVVGEFVPLRLLELQAIKKRKFLEMLTARERSWNDYTKRNDLLKQMAELDYTEAFESHREALVEAISGANIRPLPEECSCWECSSS